MKRKVTFRKFIESYGIEKLAKDLDVGKSTVGHWRAGCRIPRVAEIEKIRTLSEGRVTADAMVDHYLGWKASR